jgi:hypothetical protein
MAPGHGILTRIGGMGWVTACELSSIQRFSARSCHEYGSRKRRRITSVEFKIFEGMSDHQLREMGYFESSVAGEIP